MADYGEADVLIGNTEGTYNNVRSFIAEILEGGAILIILGGDRAVAACGAVRD